MMANICEQHAALQLIASVEAVLETIAALVATVAHGQGGAIMSRIFLGILVAGVRQRLTAKAAQLILAHGAVRIAITQTLLIQSIGAGAGRLIAAIRTVDDIVTPARCGNALLLPIAGQLIRFRALETLLRLFRQTQIGGVDDLALMSHARLIGMPHLEIGIGEARLAARRQIVLHRLSLSGLSLLVLHVGAVDLLLSILLLLW